MNIKDFEFNNNTFLYEKDDIPFIIYISYGHSYAPVFRCCVTSEKQGVQVLEIAKEIVSFLRSHFYEHPTFRMKYVFTDKPPIHFEIRIDKNEFRYYYKEFAQVLSISLLSIEEFYRVPSIILIYIILFSIFLGFAIDDKMKLVPIKDLNTQYHISHRKQSKRLLIKIICPSVLLIILISLYTRAVMQT